jgi:hypothetical protein
MRVDHPNMAPSVLLLALGLGSGLVGAATATDVVSLRALAHSVDVPLLSMAVIGMREAMPTSLAHALEPTVGLLGCALVAATALRRTPRRALAAVRRHPTALRTALALTLLRTF